MTFWIWVLFAFAIVGGGVMLVGAVALQKIKENRGEEEANKAKANLVEKIHSYGEYIPNWLYVAGDLATIGIIVSTERYFLGVVLGLTIFIQQVVRSYFVSLLPKEKDIPKEERSPGRMLRPEETKIMKAKRFFRFN